MNDKKFRTGAWDPEVKLFQGGYSRCTKETVAYWVSKGYNCCVIWDGCATITVDSPHVKRTKIKCARPGDKNGIFGYTTYEVICMPMNLHAGRSGYVIVRTTKRGNDNWSWDGPNIKSFSNGNAIKFYN